MRKNVYIYFLGKLAILLLIVFFIDFTTGGILRYFYFKQETGRLARATYAIEKTRDDVLIFGSSRAYHHYNTKIIEDSLKYTCYNTGSPGQFLLYNYATLQAVLKRYTPKLIILDVSIGDFRVDNESYDRLSSLLPYYKDHPEIRQVVDLKGSFEKYKLLSSIYPYNSSFLMIAGGNSDYFKNKSVSFKGYKPLDRVWQQPIAKRTLAEYKFDPVKEQIFHKFIGDCQQAGVKLLIVCSPSFIQYLQPDYTIMAMKSYAKQKNVDFIDFTNHETFIRNGELFDDPAHLNTKGADIFTKSITDSIKSKPNLQIN